MDPFSCRYTWTGKQARAERCRNIPCSLFPVWPKSKLRYDVCVESKRILPYLGTKNNNMSNGKFQAVQGLSGSRLVVALVKKINESTPGMQAYVSMPRTVKVDRDFLTVRTGIISSACELGAEKRFRAFVLQWLQWESLKVPVGFHGYSMMPLPGEMQSEGQ